MTRATTVSMWLKRRKLTANGQKAQGREWCLHFVGYDMFDAYNDPAEQWSYLQRNVAHYQTKILKNKSMTVCTNAYLCQHRPLRPSNPLHSPKPNFFIISITLTSFLFFYFFPYMIIIINFFAVSWRPVPSSHVLPGVHWLYYYYLGLKLGHPNIFLYFLNYY